MEHPARHSNLLVTHSYNHDRRSVHTSAQPPRRRSRNAEDWRAQGDQIRRLLSWCSDNGVMLDPRLEISAQQTCASTRRERTEKKAGCVGACGYVRSRRKTSKYCSGKTRLEKRKKKSSRRIMKHPKSVVNRSEEQVVSEERGLFVCSGSFEIEPGTIGV